MMSMPQTSQKQEEIESAPARRRIGLQTRRTIAAYLFLTPALIFFTIFYFIPIGLEFWVSFRTGQPLLGTSTFTGLNNYSRAFTDPRVINSFKVTLFFAFGSTIVGILVGLGLALLLNQNLRGRILFRAILFFPYMTTFVIVALMWSNILDPTIGILNNVLRTLNLPTQSWLASYDQALPALIGITVWHTAGYNMILFLAGLQGIPGEFYEAAKIDGASPWGRFWHITLPLLTPTTLFISVISVILSLQAFIHAYIITRGGPADATRLAVFHIFNVAFTELNFGYASALAFLMLVVILIFTLIQLKVGDRQVQY